MHTDHTVYFQGICMIVGGLKHSEQRFNMKSAAVSASLLFISIAGAFTPTIFSKTYGNWICSVRSILYQKLFILCIYIVWMYPSNLKGGAGSLFDHCVGYERGGHYRVLKCDVIKFSFLHLSIFMTIFQ